MSLLDSSTAYFFPSGPCSFVQCTLLLQFDWFLWYVGGSPAGTSSIKPHVLVTVVAAKCCIHSGNCLPWFICRCGVDIDFHFCFDSV